MTTLTALIADISCCSLSLRERVGVRETASTLPATPQLATPAFKDRAGGFPHANPLPEEKGAFGRTSYISGNVAKTCPGCCTA